MFKKTLQVMKLGRSNLVMTIPAIWRDRHGIRPGDSLQVLISETELIVRPIKEKEEAKELALAPAAEGSSTPPEETEEVAKNE